MRPTPWIAIVLWLAPLALAHAAPDVEASGAVHGIGYVEPVSELRRLMFDSSGVVAERLVKEGNRVNQNQPLMKLRSESQALQTQLADANLRLAKAERAKILKGVNTHEIRAAEDRVEHARVQVNYLQKESGRISILNDRKAVSQDANDKAQTDLVQARAALRSQEAELAHLKEFVTDEDKELAESRVAVAEARLAIAQHDLQNTALLAPVDGTILKILKQPGDGIMPGDATPAVIMADLSTLRITAEIDERFVALVKLEQKAVISARGLGAKTYEGRVTRVGGIMGNKTAFSKAANDRKDLDVVQVWIEMPSDFAAPIGLEVDAAIQLGGAHP